MSDSSPQSRRQFLILGLTTAAVGALGTAMPSTALAQPTKDWRQVLLDRDRWLSLERSATGEKGQFRYYKYGAGFEREGYNAACHLLRDVEGGVTVAINPKLLDLLFLIQGWLRISNLPFHIIIQSGYRTPAHNARLAKAAKQSEHMKGNAADIRIPGLGVEMLERLAKAVGVGGVGFYPHNGFVHVDVGRVREWNG
ncbi:DUF882 domain-containing protein [Pseudomonas sp. MWU12-2323]|uniref:YcbK family protein n=1 Tax=Pseudomonas sp. MWU12-2323 TaxID=2651296 RepID=UPI00211549A1|nr:DUF882 domain-containing protein [Pseudomonas sp. MWU12-2323]